ncbi:hypothetical protein DMH04_52650 [Kibdelosporangium aridum]|uniref:Uncharacterized protein n=1 Tax=Kibdelosporangium aridum TaxID=2030 RepID=A0A428Y3X7_KIBAR|nr:hypothetical protein DMH04_52650 [Kibdelosporangium aridum]
MTDQYRMVRIDADPSGVERIVGRHLVEELVLPNHVSQAVEPGAIRFVGEHRTEQVLVVGRTPSTGIDQLNQ